MGMAGRYLNRLSGARKLLVNKSSSSSSSSAAFSAGNHLLRLLAPTATTNTRLSGFVGGNLSIRALSTLRSVSVSNDYEGKPTPPVTTEDSLNIAAYEGSSSDDSIYFSMDDIVPHVKYVCLHDDLLMQRFPIHHLMVLYRNDWSLLQRYCCSRDTVMDISVALEKKLVSMCVWFLFIEVPTHVKEGVAWALKDICSRTSEESVTRHARTKMSSFDQESVDALLVDVLCSKNEEVLKQVCSTVGLVARSKRSNQSVAFGNGVQQKLMQLSRECDSPALPHILYAINCFCTIYAGMREKIIEAEFVDGFLRRILPKEGPCNDYLDSLETEAYYMIYTIVKGQCNDELWKYVKEHLLPPLFDRCTYRDINVMTSGACVISKFIAKASPRCVEEMVDLGCLKRLINLLTCEDVTVKGYCFEAIDTILSLGDAYPKKNKYADMIDEITANELERTIYWDIFYFNYISTYPVLADEASGIVLRNRPDKFPEWDRWQVFYGGRVG